MYYFNDQNRPARWMLRYYISRSRETEPLILSLMPSLQSFQPQICRSRFPPQALKPQGQATWSSCWMGPWPSGPWMGPTWKWPRKPGKRTCSSSAWEYRTWLLWTRKGEIAVLLVEHVSPQEAAAPPGVPSSWVTWGSRTHPMNQGTLWLLIKSLTSMWKPKELGYRYMGSLLFATSCGRAGLMSYSLLPHLWFLLWSKHWTSV